MNSGKSIQKSAKLAGVSLALMFLFGILADSVIMPKIINWEDALQTSNNILTANNLFLFGIISYTGDMITNIVVAVALYFLFRPVNIIGAIIMSVLRVIYVIIRSVALSNLVKVQALIKFPEINILETSNKIMSLLQADKTGYTYALIFFGIHILLLGCLIYKSGFVSRIIGVLLIIAFAGYMFYCGAFIFNPNFSSHENIFKMILGIPAVISELSLCIYLLIKNIDIHKLNQLTKPKNL